jgi:adenosylcobinamide-phosphate synthase
MIEQPAWVMLGALFVALLIDHVLGEPAPRWHPVVWMGRYLEGAAKRFAPQSASGDKKYKSFGLGALYWCAGGAIFLIAFAAWQFAVMRLPLWVAALLIGLALKPLLALAMLCSEVLAVEAALMQSLQKGRERLAWLVSRETAQLTEGQVRESAIESLAENLNDSFIAPVFWFVVFGLPGAALYRFANTADAMWGYPGERVGRYWQWAGKWAARADDVLSWLPARITAILIWLVAGASAKQLKVLPFEAAQTPSPNSGWPMAAMALALNVRLGKPEVYTLHAIGEVPNGAQVLSAVRMARRAACLGALLASVALWASWTLRG